MYLLINLKKKSNKRATNKKIDIDIMVIEGKANVQDDP